MINWIVKSIVLAAFSLLSVESKAADVSTSVQIATGGKAGVYYPIGKSVCKAISPVISCSVEMTSGSVENAKALDKKKVNFAIIQSDIQMQALNGVKTFRDASPQIYMRSIFSLHAEPLHLMVAPNSGIRDFNQIKGKAVSFGPIGSGSYALAELILKQLDWDKKKFSTIHDLSASDQINALCNGQIKAGFWVAGVNNQAMKEAAEKCNVSLASLKGGWVDSFVLDNPQFTLVTIPKNTYKTTKSAVRTIGPKATLMTNADVPDETVYQLVKAIFESFDEFKKMHPALSKLNREDMLNDGVIAPFHPGAKKYYKEKGWVRF